MKTGKNKCIITDMGVGESKEKKTPYYVIGFENEEGESIDYIAYLTENTAERQLKVLADLGYKGKSLADMADTNKKVSDLFPALEEAIYVVVEEEGYTTDDGIQKTRKVAKWVNVGERGGVSKLEHKQAVTVFKALSFDGDLARIRQGQAAPKAAKKPDTKPAPNSDFVADDIPF
jgi:hypothetical protein